MKLSSYALGEWIEGRGEGRPVYNAVNGELIGQVSSQGLDFQAMLKYGRDVGGPALRKMTFHERALMLKAMALYLNKRKEEFYQLNYATGATRKDGWVDIDGGIGTFFVYSGKGRRDFPNETFYVDGPPENISRGGTFMGRHICVPLEGVATHINAYNFPCWGMLEKLAPTFLAGMPAIVKPATASSYLTRKMVQAMAESGILPDGALQLIVGGVGDLFEHLTEQDVVTFTGSAYTGRKLKSHAKVIENSVRFNMEADSLNMCILGPDAAPGTPEFDLFVKEVVSEMTVKAGQKCTAIRRTIVPEGMVGDVIDALKTALDKVKLGDPMVEGVGMGALVSRDQMADVAEKVEILRRAGDLVYGGMGDFEVLGGDKDKG
ncbi:MAG: aldehyde dehydrogenase family protein, partial [Acidobacteriota bacterium]|nr:aldehyde dehydrogenase family protein [Acidobacteriota bacterium]